MGLWKRMKNVEKLIERVQNLEDKVSLERADLKELQSKLDTLAKYLEVVIVRPNTPHLPEWEVISEAEALKRSKEGMHALAQQQAQTAQQYVYNPYGYTYYPGRVL